MGLFDFLAKTQEKIENFQKSIADNTTPEHFIQLINNNNNNNKESVKQSKTAKQIIKRFYADYPETPFISNERPADWIERAEVFPKQCIISKETMTRFSDGLLPGHVYMIYWLKKYTNKKVPVYFEYKYGIDFEKEKVWLFERGYLDNFNKPTERGEEAIKRHCAVIESHSAATKKPDNIDQILAQRDSLIRNGSDRKEYEEWLDFLDKGGTSEEYERLKRKDHSK